MEEKNLKCKNCQCANNSKYKTDDKDNGFCTIFTEENLGHRTYCAEREW